METVRRLSLGIAMLFAASRILLGQTPALPPAAVVVELEKIVEAQVRGAAWKAAAMGLELGTDDRLRTGEFSRALVRLSDLTTMRLDELTTIEISQAIAESKTRTLGVKRGGIYVLNRGKLRR